MRVGVMKGKKSFRVAIAGATGAVGQMMLKVLEERSFPVSELVPLASVRSAGKYVLFQGERIPVAELTHTSFRGVDVALFSAGASRSLEFVPAAVESGAVVVDNSSAYRMDPDIPLVVPEVNPEDVALYKKRGVIANPNCTTIIFVVPLKPLHDAFGAERVVISSYQAVSGAGAKAMEELRHQVLAFGRGQDPKSLPSEVFPYPIAFNVIPHIDAFLENGYTKEEMKAHNETRKMFHSDTLAVSATCVRVPVMQAHAVSVHAEFARDFSLEEARGVLARAPFIELEDEPKSKRYPMPLFVAGRDACFVGRIRKDICHDRALNFFVVGDQLRKGAALNAVQIAEILAKEHLQG
jgi:aspartate-semialdehyde dehydrogenase